MTTLKIHNIETAPEGSKALLENSQKAYGMIPGLHGVLAASPELLKAYQELHQLFTETSFNNDELTVVWQTINVEHACHYCVPAHTGIAKMMKVDDAIIDALRNEQQVLEIILGLSQKVISNYTNHIANTPVDEAFQKFAWSKK